ncbi:MAG: hypothetical protein H8E01_00125 [Chloroflexi bacterium]|nr:hypothetical protein [Chloroflexota bacterium]
MVNKRSTDARWQSGRPSLSRVVVRVLVMLLLLSLVFGTGPFPAVVIADTSRDPFGQYGDGDGQFHLPDGIATSSVINYFEDFATDHAEGWETSGCAAGQGLWEQTSTLPQKVQTSGKVTTPAYWYGNQPALDFKPDLPIPFGPCPLLDPPCYRCITGNFFKPEYATGDLCAFGGGQHCGNLISPRINLYNVPKPIKLTFQSCLEAPPNAVAWVEISVNSGEFFILKVIKSPATCTTEEIDLSAFAHSIIQLRWFMIVIGTSSFATNYYGWVVDDVRVKGGIGTDVGSPEDTPPQRVYVPDTGNHRVQIFEYDGTTPGGTITYLSEFGQYGDGDGQFNRPEDVFVGPSAKVWVADTGNHRIQIFDADGNYEGEFGQYYDVPWTFNSPSSIAVSAIQLREPFQDSFLYVYVADTGNHRVQSFRFPANQTSEWGFYGDLDGEFHLPEGIDIDPIEPQFPNRQPPMFQNDTTPEDWEAHLYVADMGNHRVQYFTQEGTFVDKFGIYGDADSQFKRPQDVGVGIRLEEVSTTAERLVDVYVADTDNHRIQYFDGTGSYLDQFGLYGVGLEEFNSPAGIAVDRLPPAQYPDAVGLEGDVFIMDTGNHRGQCLDTRP